MTIFSIIILNKHAGMIYTKDFSTDKVRTEVERVLTYPLDIKIDDNGYVRFGARDGIRIGHSILGVNGQPVTKDKNNKLKFDNKGFSEDVIEFLKISTNYPVNLKFGKPPLTLNDKFVLTGRFFG
jgi:hypothetical protein